MPKKPDERYDKAYEMYQQGFKLVEIASQLNLSEGTVRSWKNRKWNATLQSDKCNVAKRKGGQPGNKNATGPPKNRHAEKHGFFTKWLPEETLEIFEGISKDDPLDLLWDNIQLQYAAIIRAQKLMYVNDQKDLSKEVNMISDSANAFDVQYAWDKHANFMSAQSRSMKTLESMIKQYDELLHKNWKQASEEQVARINQIKAQTKKLESDNGKETTDSVVIHDDIPKPN